MHVSAGSVLTGTNVLVPMCVSPTVNIIIATNVCFTTTILVSAMMGFHDILAPPSLIVVSYYWCKDVRKD